MDLDAEFARIQEEARQKVAAEHAARDELRAAQAPADIDERVRAELETPLDADLEELPALSLGAKIGLGVGGVIAFLLLWSLVLKPILFFLITVAVLVLIVAAIWKLLGGGKDDEEA